MTSPKSDKIVMSIRLSNVHDTPLTVYLEPWGEVHELPPRETFEAMAEGPAGDTLALELGADRITVLGWPGSTVRLFHEGRPL